MPRSPFHMFASGSATTIFYVFIIFPIYFENMFIQSLIWLSYYLVKCANYEATQSAVLSLLLLLLFMKL